MWKWAMTDKEALDMGFSHAGSYYGIPVYLGDIEFPECEVMCKYRLTDWLFTFVSFLEWMCTPPNAGSMFFVMRELE